MPASSADVDLARALYDVLRMMDIDERLRDLHGRTDDEARRQRDRLLDERIEHDRK